MSGLPVGLSFEGLTGPADQSRQNSLPSGSAITM
jgi:hypothetical protein